MRSLSNVAIYNKYVLVFLYTNMIIVIHSPRHFLSDNDILIWVVPRNPTAKITLENGRNKRSVRRKSKPSRWMAYKNLNRVGCQIMLGEAGDIELFGDQIDKNQYQFLMHPSTAGDYAMRKSAQKSTHVQLAADPKFLIPLTPRPRQIMLQPGQDDDIETGQLDRDKISFFQFQIA